MNDEGKNQSETRALIIGGGIAGCALALFLKRSGIRSTIFEAYSQDRTCGSVGGGLQISPNGMRVLNELGLASTIASLGIPSHHFIMQNQAGKTLVDFRVTDFADRCGTNITRSALHEALLQAVGEIGEDEGEQLITTEFDKKLVSITEEEATVTAVFEDGSSATGSFLVGADGVHSVTRALLLGEEDPKPRFAGLMATGGFVQSDLFLDEPEEKQGAMHFLSTPSRYRVGYCRVKSDDPRLVMWWRNINVKHERDGQPPSRDELQAIDLDELKQRILDVPGGWPSQVSQLVTDTRPDQILRGTVQDLDPLPRWFSGRVVLVGDAAHAVSPHSGQGASQALESAMYLAKTIHLALLDYAREQQSDVSASVPKQVLERAFRVFEAGRRARVEEISAQGRMRGEPQALSEGEQPPSAMRQWASETILKGIFHWVLPSAFRKTYGYTIKWDDCETLDDVVKQQLEEQRGWWRWW